MYQHVEDQNLTRCANFRLADDGVIVFVSIPWAKISEDTSQEAGHGGHIPDGAAGQLNRDHSRFVMDSS
jgi:hypothetical protein